MRPEVDEDEAPLLREPLSLRELALYRERLETMLESFRIRAEAAEEEALEPSGGARFQEDDEAIEEVTLATDLGALEAEEELAFAVEDALRRIRAGTYGTCGACGEWVSRERLHHVPYARLCRRCVGRHA